MTFPPDSRFFPFPRLRAALISAALFAAVFCGDAGAQSLSESVEAWEAQLDAVYAPDPYDPEIPFLPEKKTNPEIEEKRAAFKTKLQTVGKFKKKVRPEEIDKWFAKIMPTATDPLALSINAELRKDMREKFPEYERVPADEVFTHPSARFFPGDVPAKFARVRKPFYLNPKVEGWQCTGLYAAPGERVKILHVSKSAVGVGLKIRIGAHTDDLLASRQRCWRRFPRVTREFAVREQSFEIASPFGGLIYVYAPKGRATARTQFVFSGGVEAPFFVLGATKPKDWEYIRYAPAPWAEFVGKNFIATIPADEAAAIDEPEKVIRFWDGVVADLDKLTARPKERTRPERFVVDLETSAAAGHSGDPVAGNLLWSRSYWDLERIRRDGAWELFFALGRNFVSDKWTFGGDRDTPAALLALFCMEKATGKKADELFSVPALQNACFARIRREKAEEKNKKALRDKIRNEEIEEKERWRRIIKDVSSGKGRREREKEAREADVEDERSDPGVPYQRLSAYIPVIGAAGWEPLARVFKLYTIRNRLPLANDDEKRRTFVMLWSQATKKNLSPYFEHFDFPRQGGAMNYARFAPENFPPEEGTPPPENGGTGYLGVSLFPTIAVLNADCRVPQLPRPDKKSAGTLSPFGSLLEDDDADSAADDEEEDDEEEDADETEDGAGTPDEDAEKKIVDPWATPDSD